MQLDFDLVDRLTPAWALKLEHEVSKIMYQQQVHGVLFHTERAKHFMHRLEQVMGAISQRVDSFLPTEAKPVETTVVPWDNELFVSKYVTLIFTKAGKYRSNIVKFWGEDVTNVCGPYTRVTFQQVDIGSNAQVKTYLLSIGWKPQEWNINKKTGDVTSPKMGQDEPFLGVDGVSGKLIVKYIRARHRHSQVKGWLERVRPDSRLPASANPQGTPTVRMTHRVVVNVPGETAWMGLYMRSLFIVPEGYVMVGGDAKSCQLRLLANYMGDEQFTYAVLHGKKEEGTDPHSVNMRAAGLPNRRIAKNFIYGFIFGAQAAKVGTLLGKGKKEGQKIMDNYMENMPKLAKLRSQLLGFWEEYGYIELSDGRRVYPRAKHMLLCYLLQGDEAVFMKLACVLANHWIKQNNIDASQVIFMHDELQYEVLKAHAGTMEQILLAAMATASQLLQFVVPQEGDVSIGRSWKETH